jgi:hypothetical protein
MVSRGHVTKPPSTKEYASVVSSVSERFFYAALNDLENMSADIQGTYNNAPWKEMVETHVVGLNFTQIT